MKSRTASSKIFILWESQKQKRESKILFKNIMSENLPNLRRDIDISYMKVSKTSGVLIWAMNYFLSNQKKGTEKFHLHM